MTASFEQRSWRQERVIQRSPRQQAARAVHEQWTRETGAHLFIVDDRVLGRGACQAIHEGLAARGVYATTLDSGLDALVELGRTDPGAVIVSSSLPDMSAEDFVQKVREHSDAVVLAVRDTSDATAAAALIAAGAFNVISRPYDAETIWTALGRRTQPLDDHALLSYGPIELDARAFVVSLDGRRLRDLPYKEFAVLRALLKRAPDVVSNAELRATVWGDSVKAVSDNTITVYIRRLRQRLGSAAEIRRVRGRGYALTLT
jgi:DNA-binding response OmpR family regulator